jgi:translocation and assembly module TamB
MIGGVKRRVALAFVAAVLVATGGGVLALRTSWAGDRLCALAEVRVRQAKGLHLALAQCRVEPFRLEASARGVRLGPEGAPVFEAEAVRARFAPVQALGKRLELAELTVVRPRLTARLPAQRPGEPPLPCPPPLLQSLEIRQLHVDGGAVDLTLPGGERVVVGRLDVRSAPASTSWSQPRGWRWARARSPWTRRSWPPT